MATNLLLEGDDLEALLIKAHSEGGPNARIVRADKYRHGGLWGFFARERFEVAVEIPEQDRAAGPRGPGGGPGGPGGPGEGPDGGGAGADGGAQGGAAGAFDLTLDGHLAHGSAVTRAPVDRLLDDDPLIDDRFTDDPYVDDDPLVDDRLAGDPLVHDAPLHDGPLVHDAPLHDGLLRPDGHDRHDRHDGPAGTLDVPEPGALAADGLLGVAERVSAAERAAARAVEAMLARDRAAAGTAPPFPGGAVRAVPEQRRSIALPGAELVGATLASMSRGRGAAPLVGTAPATRPTPRRPAPAARPATAARRAAPTNPYPTARPTAPARGRLDDADALDLLRAVAAEEDDVAHDPTLSPVRPSTSRPEFTALLDQLRDGARPGRRAPGRVVRGTTAYLDDDLAPGGDALRVPAPRPQAPAPDQRAGHRPGPAAPEARQAVEDDLPEAAVDPLGGDPGDVRTGDPRAAADRHVLRALGVPAAWTRRLRPGDRFGEVLRMLERMPDQDIHPDAPVIAVVGPPGTVRLEAHRTAVDLAVADEPRAVVTVPATVGTDRAAAIARALRSGPVVLAVETDGRNAGLVLDTLTTVQAGAVIAVVDAAAPLEATQRWLDALGQVDALALDGGSAVHDPAAVLQLGLPVVRFDGIPVDRVTWAALLCAQLLAAEQAGWQPDGEPLE